MYVSKEEPYLTLFFKSLSVNGIEGEHILRQHYRWCFIETIGIVKSGKKSNPESVFEIALNNYRRYPQPKNVKTLDEALWFFMLFITSILEKGYGQEPEMHLEEKKTEDKLITCFNETYKLRMANARLCFDCNEENINDFTIGSFRKGVEACDAILHEAFWGYLVNESYKKTESVALSMVISNTAFSELQVKRYSFKTLLSVKEFLFCRTANLWLYHSKK
jgi:hypothetical protein